MDLNNENKEEAYINNFQTRGGFVVPDGYFEDAEKALLNKTIHAGFTVPEHYFDQLTQRIEQKTAKQVVPKSISLYTYIKVGMAVAASFIAIAGIYFMLSNHTTPVTDFSGLSEEEILNYIEVSDIQDHQLIELAVKSEAPPLSETEEYLINTADAELIIEEL